MEKLKVGDRVAYRGTWRPLVKGMLGSIVGVSGMGSILVQWDGLTKGHQGNPRHVLLSKGSYGTGDKADRYYVAPSDLHKVSVPQPRKRPEPTDTSRQALQSQKDKAPSDCAKILGYLKTHVTGRTCDHVERVLRMSHQTASARIRDLAASGKIMDSGRREKTRTGRPAICWKAVG